VANIDVAPTIADLAGVDLAGADGSSFAGLLDGSEPAFRRRLLIESAGAAATPPFCGVATPGYHYVWYEPTPQELRRPPWVLGNGYQELYNRKDRSVQLRNRVRASGRESDRRQMNRARAVTRELCRPRPPGLSRIVA
jgi:arylsulfatase A-like enzyme